MYSFLGNCSADSSLSKHKYFLPSIPDSADQLCQYGSYSSMAAMPAQQLCMPICFAYYMIDLELMTKDKNKNYNNNIDDKNDCPMTKNSGQDSKFPENQ
jgi:hypothetical protein